MVRRLVSAVTCALVMSAGLATSSTGAAAVGGPTVTGPITSGNGVPVVFAHTSFDLSKVGYRQSEFFIAGTATAYKPSGTFAADGKWALKPASHAPYKTRIVVDRPVGRPFNGTVVVEWLNVSGGVDASPDWIQTHVELIRSGFAWVGVSAQAVGLNALKNPPDSAMPGDPVRYGSLRHPGDSYSYDMFSQAGRVIRTHAAKILGGLKPRKVLGVGESQSAGRLVTYIDGVHPLAHAYDGFLVHSRGATGSPLSQDPLPAVPVPAPTLIRTDLNVPVLQFETETDLLSLGFIVARQPDAARIVTWEVAGTSHFDLYGLKQGATDRGMLASVADWFDSMQHPTNQPAPGFTCDVPINSGPQTYVLRAAVSALSGWVSHGKRPPASPRLRTRDTTPPEFVVDRDGIALGGIRTPAVDVPVATLSGLGQTGGTSFCFIFGSTVPFSGAKLKARYGDHGRFADAWSNATLESSFDGFLRPADALQIMAAGVQSNVLR